VEQRFIDEKGLNYNKFLQEIECESFIRPKVNLCFILFKFIKKPMKSHDHNLKLQVRKSAVQDQEESQETDESLPTVSFDKAITPPNLSDIITKVKQKVYYL
jgi:hypothetical protein